MLNSLSCNVLNKSNRIRVYISVIVMIVCDKEWLVYIVICDDDSLYTGITNDLDKRYKSHQSGKGAKYFRIKKPLAIVYTEAGHNRSSALKREAEIKKLSKLKKQQLIKSRSNERDC